MAEREHRRAIVRLGEQEIAHLLQLPEGLRILGVSADFRRMSLLVMVEGEQLESQPEATVLPELHGEWEYHTPATDEGGDGFEGRLRWHPPNYPAAS